MKKVTLTFLVMVVTAAGLALACGDDDDDSSTRNESVAVEADTSIVDDGAESAAPQTVGDDAIEEETGDDGASAVPSEGEAPVPASLGTFDRKIIESATIEVEVDNVVQSFSTASRIAAESGGFVASSNVFSEDDERFATLTIRVPASEYSDALERLRGLGEVVSEGSNANDVTEEFTDLESRLRNLEAIEAQYVQLLSQATTIDEILVVQDRLNVTRAEIEQIKGRINVINDLSELASIEVFLAPPAAAPAPEGGEGWQLFAPAEAALENSYDALRHLASGVIAAGIYGLWILPLAVIGLFAARVLSRRGTTQTS